MDISSKVKIHNKFDIVVRDAKTGEQKERYEAYNIVKDYCYDRILNSPSSLWSYIAYGSGTGTPDPTTRTLLNFLGSVSARRDSLTYGMPTTVAVYTGRIAANQAVGQLITEIGLASSSSSNSILTHALIKDSAGNPIAIQKTDQDIIDIYATVYFNLEDLSATYGNNVQWVNPKDNAIIQRLLGSSDVSYRSSLYREAVAHDDIFYLSNQLEYTFNISVDVPNRKILLPTTRFNENTANGTIKGMTVLNAVNIKFPVQNIWNGFQFENIDVATGDGSTVDFSLPWDNIRPGTLQVFVDGTPVTPVEVHEDKFSAPITAADGFGGLPRMSGMSWQQNGNYVAVGTTSRLRIYRISPTGRISMTDSIQYTDKSVLGVDFTSDFSTLVVVTSDGAFTVYDFDPVSGTIGPQSYTAGDGMSQLAVNAMANLNNLRVVPGDKVVILNSNEYFVSNRKFATVSLDTTLKRYGDLVQFANITFDSKCDISADGKVLLIYKDDYYNYPLIVNFDPETGTVGTSKELSYISSNHDEGLAIHPQKLGVVAAGSIRALSRETAIRFGALDENLDPLGNSFYSSYDGPTYSDYDSAYTVRFSPDGALVAAGRGSFYITIHEVDFNARAADLAGYLTDGVNSMIGHTYTRVVRVLWVANDVIAAYVNSNYANDSSFFTYKITRGPKYHFKLPTPPAPGAKITASFAVDYIPKSSDYVLDISASIQLM